MKEPFITTSHSKYHLHLSYNDIAEWARQVVELETTVKKPPYELRAFQTRSPEPILQNKKNKRSAIEDQEPIRKSKSISTPLKHSCSKRSVKSTIDLTGTPTIPEKISTRHPSSYSPAVATRTPRSTKHKNSTPVPALPTATTATTAATATAPATASSTVTTATTTAAILFNSSPPPSLSVLFPSSSVEILNAYFFWLQQKHPHKSTSLNRILAILKQEGFIYKSVISKSNFNTILSILSLAGISRASGLLCIIQDEVQSYWRYQNTINREDSPGTNNLQEMEGEEVYESLYENDYDIDEMF